MIFVSVYYQDEFPETRACQGHDTFWQHMLRHYDQLFQGDYEVYRAWLEYWIFRDANADGLTDERNRPVYSIEELLYGWELLTASQAAEKYCHVPKPSKAKAVLSTVLGIAIPIAAIAIVYALHESFGSGAETAFISVVGAELSKDDIEAIAKQGKDSLDNYQSMKRQYEAVADKIYLELESRRDIIVVPVRSEGEQRYLVKRCCVGERMATFEGKNPDLSYVGEQADEDDLGHDYLNVVCDDAMLNMMLSEYTESAKKYIVNKHHGLNDWDENSFIEMRALKSQYREYLTAKRFMEHYAMMLKGRPSGLHEHDNTTCENMFFLLRDNRFGESEAENYVLDDLFFDPLRERQDTEIPLGRTDNERYYLYYTDSNTFLTRTIQIDDAKKL